MTEEKRTDLLFTGEKVDKKRKRKTDRKKKKRNWSDLSEDITSIILQRLTLVDRIRFSLTCKTWLLSSPESIQSKLPWIMEYSDPKTKPRVCLLYEPSNNGREKMAPYIAKDEKQPPPEFFSDGAICASGFGWLLWSKTVYDGIKITYFYVYNPFFGKNIRLPKFKWQRRHRMRNLNLKYATFTAVPTSPECVFRVVHTSNRSGEIFISSCSKGDTKWNTRCIMHSPQHFFPYGCITYMNDKFYCFGQYGNLSSFDLATQKWSLLSKRWNENLSRNSPYTRGYILSHGGNLYLVNNHDYSEISKYCKVYKFDWIDGIWKMIKSLGGGTIFLNSAEYLSWGSFVMSGEDSEERTDQTNIAANRIYRFFPDFNPVFHTYGPRKNGNFNGNEEERDMPYWGTPARFHGNERIWVEPPLSTP